MEEQEELNLGIGTKETVALKPAKVKIVKATVEPAGKGKKVSCEVKHPEKEETIKISELRYIKGTEVVVSGTWLNQDEDGLIRKGSALANLLNHLGCKTIKELEGKEVDTELDAKGYLCFKAY